MSLDQSILGGGELGLGSPGAASPTKPAGQYYQHYSSNPRRRTLQMDTMGEKPHTKTHNIFAIDTHIVPVAPFSIVTIKRGAKEHKQGNY